MLGFWWLCENWGREFVRFFYDDARVLDVAEHYIHWVSPSYIGLGIGIVLGSAIQGAGATRQTLRLDSLVVAVIQVPLCALIWALNLDQVWLWHAIAATYFSFAIAYVISYRRGAFLQTKLA